MKAHVARVARTCFYHLRRPRSIRLGLGRDVTARLVSALVISRLDYCNSLLAHLPASTLVPLQRVINATARMVVDFGPHDHVTPALYKLYWLPITERIKFKLYLLVHHSISGRAPSYLIELVTSVANVQGRATLRSAGRQDLVVSRSRLVLSEQAISVAAPRDWNSLPVDIWLITNTKLFKKKLKTSFQSCLSYNIPMIVFG